MPTATWHIYSLEDPRRPGVVRYVGWTKNVLKRLRSHLALAKNGRDQTRCGNWKRSLLREGVTPTIQVLESGSGPDWGAVESRWIAHFRQVVGCDLTNHTEGGEGFRGPHSPSTKERMSRAQKGVPKNRTAEHTANLMAALKKRQWTPEVRAKMRTSHLGKKATDDHRSSISTSLKSALQDPELRRQRSESMKAIAGSVEERKTRSLRMKELWADPIRRKKFLEARRKA